VDFLQAEKDDTDRTAEDIENIAESFIKKT